MPLNRFKKQVVPVLAIIVTLTIWFLKTRTAILIFTLIAAIAIFVELGKEFRDYIILKKNALLRGKIVGQEENKISEDDIKSVIYKIEYQTFDGVTNNCFYQGTKGSFKIGDHIQFTNPSDLNDKILIKESYDRKWALYFSFWFLLACALLVAFVIRLKD